MARATIRGIETMRNEERRKRGSKTVSRKRERMAEGGER